ncbi:MAG: hypothetical protein Q9169_006000 [Polycauliona sp. 2 TL-2023]
MAYSPQPARTMTQFPTMEPQTVYPGNQDLEEKMTDWEKDISSSLFCDMASCSSQPCHDECSQNNMHGCDSSSFCDDPSICCTQEDCVEATCPSSCHSVMDVCPSVCGRDHDTVANQQTTFEHGVGHGQDLVPCQWLLQNAQCDAMVPTLDALGKHLLEQHVDPLCYSRCPQDPCFDLTQKTNLPDHHAGQHQLDKFLCHTNDCFETYDTFTDLNDHFLSTHGPINCRYGGCEVSTNDPWQLKHHIVEDHLDSPAIAWPEGAAFGDQYNLNNQSEYMPSSVSTANAVNYPAYSPNGAHDQTQYFGPNIPYTPAYDINATDYTNQAAPHSNPSNHCQHHIFDNEIQTAWHASDPAYTMGLKPGKDVQAMDQVNASEISPTATTPASNNETATTGHVCQWIMDSGNNILCHQAFDTTKALQEHLRRDHCTLYNATRSTAKASAICRWHGCSRQGEPLTDIHKLIRHALTHSNYRDYVCSFCEKACTTKGQLVIHERVHTGEKPIKCEFCSKTTSNESQMAIHRRTHTGEKPHRCDICDFRCADSTNLIKHKKSHFPNAFHCEICNRSFNRKHTLMRHMKVHGKK